MCADRADAAGGEHHPRHRPVPPETLRLHGRPGQVAGGQRHQEHCHDLHLISTLKFDGMFKLCVCCAALY